MNSLHPSSPLIGMHSSLTFLVSGQEQQIFLPDFPLKGAGAAVAVAKFTVVGLAILVL